MAQLAKGFNNTQTPNKKQPVKPTNTIKEYPSQKGYTHPTSNITNHSYPHPASYTIPTQNRFAPLDNQSLDPNYYHQRQGPNSYSSRPPRGHYRGNYRGRSSSYQNHYQQGGGIKGVEGTLQNPTHGTHIPQRIFRKTGPRGRGRKKKKVRSITTAIFNLTNIVF